MSNDFPTSGRERVNKKMRNIFFQFQVKKKKNRNSENFLTSGRAWDLPNFWWWIRMFYLNVFLILGIEGYSLRLADTQGNNSAVISLKQYRSLLTLQ